MQRSTLTSATHALPSRPNSPRPHYKTIVVMHPLELIHLDYLCLEPGKGHKENVLVVTDQFTQYAEAYVTWSQTAHTTAKALWENFVVYYGLPEKILLDLGRILSQLVVDLCMLMGPKNCKPVCITLTLMGSVRDLIPLWLVCWQHYPHRRNQTGRTTLEH